MADEKGTQTKTARDAEVSNLDDAYNAMLSSLASKNSKLINILKDFPWTLNYNLVTERIPRVYINEYRQNLSTFAATLAYYSSGVTESVLGEFGLSKADRVNLTGKSGNNAFNKILNFGQSSSSADTKSSELAPYYNMYFLDETNCSKYVFPYYENDFIDINNNYGDSSQQATGIENDLNDFVQNHLQQWVGLYGNIASTLSGGILSNQTSWDNSGIFIERPRYFQYDAKGDTVKVNFTLYNTLFDGTLAGLDKWKKNYQFIQSFALKNLPYKVSLFRYKTPLLYEVSVPGVKYLPISYVSNFRVGLKGTRRMLSYYGKSIIVPDAWEIQITFTSLLAKTANAFMGTTKTGPTVKSNGIQVSLDGPAEKINITNFDRLKAMQTLAPTSKPEWQKTWIKDKMYLAN